MKKFFQKILWLFDSFWAIHSQIHLIREAKNLREQFARHHYDEQFQDLTRGIDGLESDLERMRAEYAKTKKVFFPKKKEKS